MTDAPRAALLAALVALSLVSCTTTKGASGGAAPVDVFAGAISTSDVGAVAGDAANWWAAPPTFGRRPLDSASMPLQVLSETIVRFVHVGTPETLSTLYVVWDTPALATALMGSYQTALGTPLTGPRAGDQSLYYQQQQSFGAAPYVTTAYVRVGETIIQSDWSRSDAFAGPSQLGKIAVKTAARLKQVIGGSLRATPLQVSDMALLPPAGPYLVALGSARLPIEAAVVMVHTADPHAMALALHQATPSTFVFGDYTLDNDTHMEVQTATLDFQSPQDAAAWVDDVRGSNQLSSDGFAVYFDSVTGQYFLVFSAGTRAAVLVCRSVADSEAASRSCEVPLLPVASSWKASLGA